MRYAVHHQLQWMKITGLLLCNRIPKFRSLLQDIDDPSLSAQTGLYVIFSYWPTLHVPDMITTECLWSLLQVPLSKKEKKSPGKGKHGCHEQWKSG